MREITTIGKSLFQIAAEQYGDALQWINLARANALSDPVLTGQVKAKIPPYSSAFSDGIGPQ